MLTSPTLDKLRDLNLMGISRGYQAQMERADYQALSFDDRLGMLVDEEMQDRENRRLHRYLKAARLRDQACVEDIDFHAPRGLDRSLIRELAEARWIDAHQNVLVIGATGVGKTYVACALAEAAIRKGHTALYLRFPRMIDELAVSRVDGRMPRLLATWARVEVLLLDDFAMRSLTGQQSADLLEVIEDRSQRRSTIVTSQMPVKQWHEALGDATIADAVLDRLIHNAHRIELRGHESIRRSQKPGATATNDVAQAGNGAGHTKSGAAAETRRATTPAEAR
ncbi:MAG: IS21-like element helper ATPase IstB [Candidatus Dormibacteraceae bacterium]